MKRSVVVSSKVVAIGVALVLLAATWIGYTVQNSTLDERTRSALTAHAEELADSYANDVSTKLNFVSAVMDLIAFFDGKNGMGPTVRFVKQNRLYRGMDGNIVIVNAHGDGSFVGSKGDGPIAIGDRPHFRAALNSKGSEFVVGAPVIGRIRREIAIPFARPVRGTDGTVVGVESIAIRAVLLGRLRCIGHRAQRRAHDDRRQYWRNLESRKR